MIASPEVRIYIKMIAKKLGLTLAETEGVIRSTFEFQSHIMKHLCDRKTSYFPSVRIPYWGIFYCPPYTRDRLKRLNDKNNGDKPDTSSDLGGAERDI